MPPRPSDTRLFLDNPLAERQPKSDRLILARLLDAATGNNHGNGNPQLEDAHFHAAHQILIRWADLETSGRLTRMKETQLQGDFLREVFGDALGYARAVEGADRWHLIQHQAFGDQTPDAVLGLFTTTSAPQPAAVVELKGPRVHLDRDRSNHRTAVEQCWDYLVNLPRPCRWGIVSNIVSFRLYERDATRRAYEHFTLQSLRDLRHFRSFYCLLHRRGLIEGVAGQPPRAVDLLQRSVSRQRAVGDELYEHYSQQRTLLIEHLHFTLGHPLHHAIEMAQRLFDRVIFIAFCEDRGLLHADTIKKANTALQGFSAVTNPRWQNFKTLFRFIDAGSPDHHIPGYNGGLFAPHPVDDLELPDRPWTDFFATLATFSFADEVNLDVLGHLFERSITELEKLKESGLFGGNQRRVREYAQMPQSAKRKQLGIYYTPPTLTTRVVQYTVEELLDERCAAAAELHAGADPDSAAYWSRCLELLRDLKIVDPACGSGAFLFQAYHALEQRYHEVIGHLARHQPHDAAALFPQIPRFILNDNLYGVDLSPEAVEITQLALWIRSATRTQSLATLSRNIVHGNSLVHDPAAHPAGFDWRTRFPEVFNRPTPGFDCVIGNPPWERIKLQEREFFALPAPQIATTPNAASRRRLVAQLESDDPALHARYTQALADAQALLDYCRTSGHYPLTGKGDINTYAVFAELAARLVAPTGRVGLLTPSGIASDNTTKDFFAALAGAHRLLRLYDFENRTRQFFPEVDNRFKFCILNFTGAAPRPDDRAADFAFFLHDAEELEDRRRHVPLTAADLKLLNPNTGTCPIFRTRRDADLTRAVYRRIPILIDRTRRGPTGNPWGITFHTMFHQTNDAEKFLDAATLETRGYRLQGNRYAHPRRKSTYLPLYEAKMVQAFDHRAADVVTDRSNWVRQGQTVTRSLAAYQNPEALAQPRYWVAASDVPGAADHSHLMAFKDVTSPTNQRTMIAAFLPSVAVVNSAPILVTGASPPLRCCLLANLNAVAFDFLARQKISNVHLNFFIVEQVPTLPPEAYAKACPWDRRTKLVTWISDRVLKLSCTAEDMLPLAEACGFTGGSFTEYDGKLHRWDEQDRARLLAELDAAYLHLYGIERDDAAYILSTFPHTRAASPLLPGARSLADHVLDTFDQLAARR